MVIEELDPADAAEWDAYVARSPGANCYHLHGWRAVGERGYGLRAPFLAARSRPRGELLGVLPLFFIPGGYATTGLFGAYGRVLAPDAGVGSALVEEACARAERAGLASVRIKALGPEPSAPGFLPLDRWVIARLPLAESPQAAWGGLRGKVRNCVRKAQRFGFEVRTGPDEIAGFYDVLAENMHRKGSPIYGLDWMRTLVASLGAEVITLRLDGRTVSGAITLTFNGVITVPFASSRPATFHMNPNNLLYWEIISRACSAGLHTLDFGRSLRDSSPLAFKLGWGAEMTPQPLLVRALRGKPPAMNVESPMVRAMVALWQRLPRGLADALGPSVCRRWLA
ncbi:MAG: GNAT family N-acetyltransferase [Myxococcales bacterium]|nr:GNAT family N-acetyltransferase [Myxococcales bacterium]